jgi:hypothetical protein
MLKPCVIFHNKLIVNGEDLLALHPECSGKDHEIPVGRKAFHILAFKSATYCFFCT